MKQNQVIFCSDSSTAVLGKSPTEIMRTDSGFYTRSIHNDDLAKAQAADETLRSFPPGQISELELRVRHANGTWVWLYRRESIFSRSERNEPLVKIGVAVDVTELHRTRELLEGRQRELEQAAQSLDAALADARQAVLAKTQLLANVSHELRTPLHAIMGYTSLLKPNLDEGSECVRFLEIVDKSADHLLFLIEQLLDISRADLNQLALQSEEFDPIELARECLHMVSTEKHPNVHLSFRASNGVPRKLKGDAFRVRQVILNLLTNATQFTKQGSIELELKTETEDCDDIELFAVVRDTGSGINPDFLPYIFDAFSQEKADPLHPHPGVGLGLTIAKKLTAAMGGTIEVTSEVGKGSEFVASFHLTVPESH